MTIEVTPTALLTELHADPGNVALRLAYADCLHIEYGDTLGGTMQRIIAEPAEDRWRLDYAAELERTAGTVECERCVGHDPMTYFRGRGCPTCHGTGRVSDGRAEWAAFIRVQCRVVASNPRDCNQGTCNTAGYGPCAACREMDALRTRERLLWPAVRGRFEGGGLPSGKFIISEDQ